MKLSPREARAYLRRPDPQMAGTLLSGEDPVRVAEARTQLVRAVIGSEGEAEMRLERVPPSELRRDGSLLHDAVKSASFFPGPRAVLLEEATDGLAPVVAAALDTWSYGDAHLILTAGSLQSKGALRKLFEARSDAVVIVFYDDPPSEADLVERLREAGLASLDQGARDELWAMAQTSTHGELKELIERLRLHQIGAAEPLNTDVVRALAPPAGDANVDQLMEAIIKGDRGEIPWHLSRLAAEGLAPVAVVIQSIRYLRVLLSVCSAPGGVQAGLTALRPPVFGTRRETLARAAAAWRCERVEAALRSFLELDLTLRSGGSRPDRALLERVLIRLAG